MIKVGLTGGIGSGKTLVSKIFNHLGIPVFNADNIAKIILNTNQELIKQVKKQFGNIYVNGEIDRKKLASIIFNDHKALETINSLIHPKVRENFHNWVSQNLHAKYLIEEAAILFESGAYKELDIIINVHADELVRIKRVMERDGISLEDVKSRMNNQFDDNKRIELANYNIYNSGDKMVLPQVLDIHDKILNLLK